MEWDSCTKSYTVDLQVPELFYCQNEVWEAYHDEMTLADAVDIIVNCLTELAKDCVNC